MKKANPNQKTLFQSWGNKKNQTLMLDEENNKNGYNNPIEIIDLEDDDEDEGLLAAALEMESIDLQCNRDNVIENSNYAGNFSASNSETSKDEPKEVEFLPGFDMENGHVWIYPTNYPIRDYQYEIVENSLFKNTLVTLPTGLGKTFIAAVLMYNYYRWYPQGKVIFMAPTKPLVAQQIEACYNIMGIPEADTAQMTGNMAPNKREAMWKDKRVFFLTPQVLQNDLSRRTCSPDDVVLLVFDEAHKALGNHAYCQVVREISNYTRNFRVLALSATPGDDVKAVQQVMTNLLISHMELRSEDSPDIQPYTHRRTIDKIVVPLGEDIGRVKKMFLKVLEGIVERLFCNRALWQKDPQRITKYLLLSGRDQFRKRNLEGYTNVQKGAIEGDFAMAISLYHAYELLHQHGILSFYNFIKAIIDGTKGMARAKTEIMRNNQFMEIMEELRGSIECPLDETAETSALFSQFNSPRRRSMHKQPFDTSFKSHPKLLKLEEVILNHFQNFSSDAANSTSLDTESAAENNSEPTVNTRVMIFSQYRDSVGEITAILNRHKPLVRVMSFIGQASTGKSARGLSQKEQLEVVQRFRKGGYNTLVATCVGEEGLDIGDVDLIVCFDAHASPIRLVQRMGRTGRKRNGRIVVLVSEGKEEQIYKRSLSNKKSIHKAIVEGTKSFELYDNNPRMIPRHITPRVLKMQMTVGNFVGNSKKKRKSDTGEGKSSNITSFLGKPGTSKSTMSRKDDGFLTYEELIYWQENFKLPNCEAGTTPQNYKRSRSRKSLTDPAIKELSLNEWMAWQNVPSQVYKVTHSRQTEHLIEILQFIELHNETRADDAYDVEMMSFLNEEDLIGPEDDNDMIIYDDDDNDKSRNLKYKTENKKKNEKKKVSNVKGNNDDCGENKSILKQNKARKKLKSKSVSPPQKTKWREYLKGFENEDKDFDTGEKDYDASDHFTEKTDIQAKNCCNSNDKIPLEPLSEDGDEYGKIDEKREGKGSWKQNGKESEVVLLKKDATKIEDDDFEISNQRLSQLLPSSTPQKTRVWRSRITDVTHDHAKHVPLPPSLDSLNEISSSTPNSGHKKKSLKLHQEKVSSRRNITNFNEIESPNLGFTEKVIGHNNDNSKGRSLILKSNAHENVIQDPPDLDLEFEEDISKNLEIVNNKSRKLENNSSKSLHKNNFIDEPLELDLENEQREFTNNEETWGEKSSKLDKVLPFADEALVFGASKNDIPEESRPEKIEKRYAFGTGVVCKTSNSDVFNDIEIVFGDDDTLDDGLLADLEDEAKGHNLYIHCRDEKSKNTDNENNVIGKSHNTNSGNTGDKSTLKLHYKDKQLCGNSLNKSILKLSAFERNLNDSQKKSFNSVPKIEQSFNTSTHKELNLIKKLDCKSFSNLLKEDPSDKPQRQEEFDFKKPDTIPGNRSTMTNHNVTSPRDAEHENVQNDGQLFGNPPLRKSLKLNSRTNLLRKESKRNKELPSCVSDDNLLNENTLSDIEENREPTSLSVGKLCVSPCFNSEDITDNDDSPNLKKPLRERLACHGLADNDDNTHVAEDDQNYFGIFSSISEDSPVVRKKKRSKTTPNIAAISPLQESQDIIRRRSKAKMLNGNVFAIAESDEEFENDFEESDLQLLEDETFDKPKTCVQSDARRHRDVSKQKECHDRKYVSMSDGEEKFLTRNERNRVQNAGGRHAAQRKIVLQNSVKRKQPCCHPPNKKQKRLHTSHFIDEEAELSGSDIDDFTDEESDLGDELDSFINDASQLTQRTPTCKLSRDSRSPMDMGVLYRQSLMSPYARNLNFFTPNFHRDRNRYKMKFKPKRNGSESEAEETYARESDLENELGLDNEEEYERFYGDENESPNTKNALVQELSPYKPNPDKRPLKRVKRKYILNDSVDENIIVCKETPVKKDSKPSGSCAARQSTKGFGNQASLPSSSFVPSSLLTKQNSSVAKRLSSCLESSKNSETSERNFEAIGVISSSKTPGSFKKDQRKIREESSLSNTFDFDWDKNDFSDFDLLDAVEANDKYDGSSKPCTTTSSNVLRTSKSIVQDQEIQDIALAMSATDDDVNLEMSEMPTFSLGLDLFGKDAGENDNFSASHSNQNNNKSKFSLMKTTNVWRGATFSKESSMKQPLPQQKHQQKLHHHQQQQQNKEQEAMFTKVLSLQKKSGESENQVLKSCNVSPSSSHSITKNALDSFAATSTLNTVNIKQETNLCCKSNELGINANSTPPNGTAKNIPKAFVSPSQRDKDKLVILVDTKEICNAQVVSCLRREHDIKAEVCQLIHCDYVVSNRVGVVRKLVSAVANGANASKLLEKMRVLCDLYDRPCLIIEKDRVKPGEKERDQSKTHAYSHTLACLAQTHIKVLFSESQEETAALLTEVATMESKKNSAIKAPLSLNKETQQVFRFLLNIPRVSYITALNLCSSLRTLGDLISSSPDDLQKITRQLSSSRATEIYNYLRHNFDETMTAKKKTSE